MMTLEGVLLLRDSIKDLYYTGEGNDGYTPFTLEEFEEVTEEAGLYHLKVNELEYTYPDAEQPCLKEFYWAVFKDHDTFMR